MILSKRKKEELVIKLLNEGLRFKDIAKRVHISLSDISKIKRKITGEGIEKERPLLSVPSQTFQLFKEGKSLIDVAISLDLPKDEVIQNYSDYLILKNMREVAAILQEYKNNLPTFLKLFNHLKNNIRWVDAKRAIDNNIR
jgi:DNA-binding Lrp family transcriptional regulator